LALNDVIGAALAPVCFGFCADCFSLPHSISLALILFPFCSAVCPQDEDLRIEPCKLTILRQYAATAMQSIVRSKLSRRRLKRTLMVQAAEQEEENRQWSALILQKVARGYIARRTVLRSMQIRKALSKEVLRIAERYLQHGDLWGFLKEINSELERSNQVIKENQAREDDWAQNFVEKVIHKRQSEFNTAWEEFPKALRDFNGKDDSTGVLMTKQGTERKAGGSKTTSPQKHAVSPMKSSTSAMTLAGSASAALSPTRAAAALSTTISSTGKGKRKGASSSTDITAEEVGAAMAFEEHQQRVKEGVTGEQAAHLSVPGEQQCLICSVDLLLITVVLVTGMWGSSGRIQMLRSRSPVAISPRLSLGRVFHHVIETIATQALNLYVITANFPTTVQA
jgi:hypothetical protein